MVVLRRPGSGRSRSEPCVSPIADLISPQRWLSSLQVCIARSRSRALGNSRSASRPTSLGVARDTHVERPGRVGASRRVPTLPAIAIARHVAANRAPRRRQRLWLACSRPAPFTAASSRLARGSRLLPPRAFAAGAAAAFFHEWRRARAAERDPRDRALAVDCDPRRSAIHPLAVEFIQPKQKVWTRERAHADPRLAPCWPRSAGFRVEGP